uniref:MBD domain-containing protein n=1 Tax=Strigamia maritima TaxID=126957 RepID=T1JBQ0_STRMM
MPDKDITKSATAGVTKLDRKQVEPDVTATQDAKDRFERNKAKSRAIILQCLVPRLQPAAMKFPTTKQVWDHLKALFELSSLAREAALLETFYLIRRKDNEEVDSFIARVEKAADDLAGAADDLKPADRNKAYLLINRIGKEYEHQVQAICQWQTADFTFEKVSKALLAEANRRRLAAESDKAMKSTMNYYMHRKSSKQQPTSSFSQQNASQSSSSKPNSEFLIKSREGPVPGKSGWIREQVQRQSGETAGQWDVYFYPSGQQVKLRSRPEVRSYCENELNEPYVAADYDWKPSQKPVDTVVQEPSTEQAVVEPQGATDESDNNGTSEDSYETYAVRVYLAEISEPNTYEEAIASPQKAEWVSAMREELDTLEEREVFELVDHPNHC